MYYSTLNSTTLDASADNLSLLRQVKVFCDAGDSATGGGCAFSPFPDGETNGWILTGTTNNTDGSWQCSFVCTGIINTDGTHDKNCPATPASAKVMCVGKP